MMKFSLQTLWELKKDFHMETVLQDFQTMLIIGIKWKLSFCDRDCDFCEEFYKSTMKYINKWKGKASLETSHFRARFEYPLAT